MEIMVCYDGSDGSRAALDVAIKYAHAFKAKIYLVASLEKRTEDEQKDIQNLETGLKSGKDKLTSEGIGCETQLLVRGMTPGEDLVFYAREKGVDEIIIGIRKRSKVSKLFFGSTAQYLILNAHCPVVTVK
ncbi:universal stress protein [Desulfatitalea tepidiphila]|uniref:universal stress protein n=1 Tax=Desulfatitalea tepidiphila TaxID=1185843 RepID=UPI0006B67ECE|nr:universal stress protein [Desulfatitalea tepidiphila]